MAFMNQSILLSNFVLLGFPVLRELQPYLFLVFLIIYLVSFACNLLIVAIVCWDNRLHSPMYFFICIFSLLEMCYTSVTMPRLLTDLISHNKLIPIPMCVAQFYFLFVFGSTENFLLSCMAYDRYMAISTPLRYNSIMTLRICISLAAAAWVCGFLSPLIPAIILSMTLFCGSNVIDHFYCDFSPLLYHSCATDNVYVIETAFFSLACLVILGNLVFIGISYGLVLAIIAKIPSSTGKRKTLSTCGSHMTVVFLFYGSIIYMYVRSDHSIPSHIDKVVSLFYCVVTPSLNPLIYGLRNYKLKQAIKRAINVTLFKATF